MSLMHSLEKLKAEYRGVSDQLTLLQVDQPELQAPKVDIYDTPPTPLQALRMIQRSHPALIDS
jgi:hypothetical protein